jgi:DinB superfamily
MLPDIAAAYGSLSATGEAIQSLASGLSAEEARWKPAPGKWSILEVVNHLADEEVEDFRARLDVLLHRPDDDFEPIDPRGWVAARAYLERDLLESLGRFRAERERSLEWLAALREPNLDHVKVHPSAGQMSGRQMLASWTAHDLLHVRQLARLRYERLGATAGAAAIAYAGDW